MSDLVTISSPDSADAEAYRGLRANLLAVAGGARVLLVTSPEPGAGAAETAGNLAVVCAQGGLRVVLVDADLGGPTLHQLLDMPNEAGLSEALSGGPGQPVATRVPGLSLLSAGTLGVRNSQLDAGATLRASDLFARPGAVDVFAGFRDSSDLVLVLAPPVLTSSDAATLVRHADSVILVLAAGHSRRADASAARAAFDQVGATILGVVLTGIGKAEAPFRYFRPRAATP